MMNAIILARTTAISRRGRLFAGALLRSAREHRFLYAFATVSLLVAVVVDRVTNVRPDMATVEEFGSNLAFAFLGAATVLAVGGLAWLGAVKRSQTPTRDILRFLASYLGDTAWLAAVVNALAVLTIFAVAFGDLKGAVAVLSPFSWDTTFAHADRLLALGREPYEWFWPILKSPLVVMLVNFLYNFWFFILMGSFLAAAATRRPELRHQYLWAFMGTWFVGGFLLAMLFSSAGPCYFGRLGLGHEFDPLMNALKAANDHYDIWALSTQNTLWDGYVGARSGSVGITAFPSMHVTTAVLYALFASAVNRKFGIGMWIYAAVIMIGSVVLGWHYAVDGLAAGVMAIVFWKLAGLHARRHLRAEALAAAA